MILAVVRHTLATETKKKGIYVVNDEVLAKVAKTATFSTPHSGKFATDILKFRKLNKDYTTYYVGYSDLVWPHDGCIHPQYNHSIANTGRLTHSAPNLGNVSHNKD